MLNFRLENYFASLIAIFSKNPQNSQKLPEKLKNRAYLGVNADVVGIADAEPQNARGRNNENDQEKGDEHHERSEIIDHVQLLLQISGIHRYFPYSAARDTTYVRLSGTGQNDRKLRIRYEYFLVKLQNFLKSQKFCEH